MTNHRFTVDVLFLVVWGGYINYGYMRFTHGGKPRMGADGREKNYIVWDHAPPGQYQHPAAHTQLILSSFIRAYPRLIFLSSPSVVPPQKSSWSISSSRFTIE